MRIRRGNGRPIVTWNRRFPHTALSCPLRDLAVTFGVASWTRCAGGGGVRASSIATTKSTDLLETRAANATVHCATSWKWTNCARDLRGSVKSNIHAGWRSSCERTHSNFRACSPKSKPGVCCCETQQHTPIREYVPGIGFPDGTSKQKYPRYHVLPHVTK